jgi:hypothetical protein
VEKSNRACREEKGEERKGWREKGEESGEMCVWYGEKRGRKGKMGGKKCGWDPPIFSSQKWEEMGGKERGKLFG